MPYLDWQYSLLVDSYKAFKARMELYFVDNDITDAAKKAVKIKIASGDEGMRRILSSGLSQTDLGNPSKLWKLFESQTFLNTHTINAIKKTCGNCGLQHERRAFPAYRDTCSACNNKGHWKKFCRITARKSTTQNKPPHHKHKHRRQHAMDVQQRDDTPDCPNNKDRCGFSLPCVSAI